MTSDMKKTTEEPAFTMEQLVAPQNRNNAPDGTATMRRVTRIEVDMTQTAEVPAFTMEQLVAPQNRNNEPEETNMTTEVDSTGILAHIVRSGGYVASEGTMRSEDLIPCFMELVDRLKEDRSLDYGYADPKQWSRVDDTMAGIERRIGDLEIGEFCKLNYGDEAADVLEKLFDLLDNLAPNGFTFGANEGDGACYGFWRVSDDCGVTPENRFDAARALYWFCSHNYSGQGDRLYRIFSTLGYEPSSSENGVSDDDESGDFYKRLEAQEIDVEELNGAILVAYGKVQK